MRGNGSVTKFGLHGETRTESLSTSSSLLKKKKTIQQTAATNASVDDSCKHYRYHSTESAHKVCECIIMFVHVLLQSHSDTSFYGQSLLLVYCCHSARVLRSYLSPHQLLFHFYFSFHFVLPIFLHCFDKSFFLLLLRFFSSVFHLGCL